MYNTWVELLSLLKAGMISLADYVTADLPLEEFAKGFALASQDGQIKVLLTP
jgi:threonine dehydrogenase-like Zn-dependent dehydrogenase